MRVDTPNMSDTSNPPRRLLLVDNDAAVVRIGNGAGIGNSTRLMGRKS